MNTYLEQNVASEFSNMEKIYQEQTLALPQERWFNVIGTIKS